MLNRFSWMVVLGTAVAGLAATQALAQGPTDAQRNAIKSSCRSDYIAHCSSVPPGGAASVQCLQKNMASLSSGCQTALRAIEPAAEAKPAAAPAAESKPAVTPAATEASKPPAEPAKSAAEPAPPAAPAKPATAAKTEPAKQAVSAAPAAKPSEAEVAAIRSTCRSDYPKVCSSVPPGGAAALQCLEQNKAKVSPSCAKAIAAASGGGTTPAPAAAAAAPGTAATTTAAAPATAALVLRPLRPLEELRIVRAACGGDARALCSGIEPGGGRIAQCLAANAGSLSPACRGMLAQFAANR